MLVLINGTKGNELYTLFVIYLSEDAVEEINYYCLLFI